MILYVKCVCRSSDRLLAAKYSSLGYEVRDIRQNSEWRMKARSYKARFPFTVVNEKVKEL